MIYVNIIKVDLVGEEPKGRERKEARNFVRIILWSSGNKRERERKGSTWEIMRIMCIKC